MSMNPLRNGKPSGKFVPAAVLSLGVALLAAGLMAQAEPGSPPAVSPDPVTQGSEFYETSCPQCHGDEAQGAEGPNLHNLPISNAQIATTIKYGIKGNMPAFGKKFDDHQIAALIAYLRTLK